MNADGDLRTKERRDFFVEPDGRRRFETCLWSLLGVGFLFFNTFGFFRNIWWWAFDDQADTGTLATGLLDGLARSPWWYQNGHNPGSLVFGFLLAPIYAVAGSSFLWLKLLSFLFVTGGFIFWTAAVRRAWGPSTALIFALWLVFPPPFLEWHMRQVWALHSEDLFFSGLLVFLFVRLYDSPPRFRESLVLGMPAGFASFFCMDNLLISGAIAGAAIWRWGRSGAVRLVWPTALGFLATFLPSRLSPVLPVPVYKFSGLFHKAALVDLWRSWNGSLFSALPDCAGYRGFAGPWLSRAWLLLAGLGLGLAAWNARAGKTKARGGDWLAVVLFFQLVLLVPAVGFSMYKVAPGAGGALDFYMSRRYLIIIFPALLALISYFLAELRGPWKWALLAPFLVAGCANLASGVDFRLGALGEQVHDLRSRRGDDYLRFITAAAPLSWKSRDDALEFAARLPRRWRADGYGAVGRFWPLTETIDAVANDRSLSVEARQALAVGAGRGLAQRLGENGQLDGSATETAAVFSVVTDLDKPLAMSLAVGLGEETPTREAVGHSAAEVALWSRSLLPQLTGEELFQAFARGYGLWLGMTIHTLDREMTAQKIASYEQAFASEFRGEAKTAFENGLAAGRAKSAANFFTRIVYDYPPEDFPAFRDALAQMGITLRSCGANEYALEKAERRRD